MSQQALSSTDTAPFVVCSTFRNPKADLIVVSSDNVEFRVRKAILEEASVVFRDMFSHPQPRSATLDTLPWPEPAHTVDYLLRLIYPIPKPAVKTLDDCIVFLQAADKWQIDIAVSLLRKELVHSRFLEKEALKAYAFACHMGFKKEKQTAMSKACNCDPCDPATHDQLQFMSALDLLTLVHLRSNLGADYMEYSNSTAVLAPLASNPDDLKVPNISLQPDAVVESVEGIPIPVHQLLLRAASPILSKMLDDLSAKQPTVDITSSPKLTLPEKAADIRDLRYFIYPVTKPDTRRTLEDVMHLLTLAGKYDIGVATWCLKQELVSAHHLQSKPLKIYGFACRMGLEEEKRKALIGAVRSDPLVHRVSDDFQDMSALDLLKIVDSRKQLVDRALHLINALHVPAVSNCGGAHSSHFRKSGGTNLKEYLQQTAEVTPFSDILASTYMVSRLVTIDYNFCQECFLTSPVAEKQKQELDSLARGLDALLDTL